MTRQQRINGGSQRIEPLTLRLGGGLTNWDLGPSTLNHAQPRDRVWPDSAQPRQIANLVTVTGFRAMQARGGRGERSKKQTPPAGPLGRVQPNRASGRLKILPGVTDKEHGDSAAASLGIQPAPGGVAWL